MQLREVLVILSLPGLASACSTTAPGTGAAVGYHLPRTDIDVVYDLKLTQCLDNGFTVDAAITPTLVAGAQDAVYHVYGSDLASARIKRDVKISVNSDGVITAVNTTSSDQSLAVVGSVIKTIATLAPAVATTRTTGPSNLPCNDDVLDALDRAKTIKAQLRVLRATLSKLPATQAGVAKGRELVKDVDALATELAAMTTGDGVLAVKAKGHVKLAGDASSPVLSGKIDVDASAFDKWFGKDKHPSADDTPSARDVLIDQYFGLKWDATIDRQEDAPATPSDFRTCGRALTVPAVKTATIMLTGVGKSVLAVKGKQVASVAQWAPPATVCVDVGTGDTRSIAVNFDSFGRTTEFDWSSDARAATIAAAISGASSDVQTIRKNLTGKSDDAVRSEKLARLKDEKALNELEACEAIIEAGGYNCPTVPAQ